MTPPDKIQTAIGTGCVALGPQAVAIVNATPPDKCPRCGEGVMLHGAGTTFMCGTWVAHNDNTVDQSRDCTSRQRDALAARVKELEEAGDKASARYEFVRRLTPRQFADLCRENISTGIPFDDLVDRGIERGLGT